MILNNLDQHSEAKFKEFYDQVIAQELNKIELNRKSILKKFLICSSIGIPLILISCFAIYWMCNFGNQYFYVEDPIIFLYFEVLLVILAVFFVKSIYHFPIAYKNSMKKSLLTSLLKFYGDFQFVNEKVDYSQLHSYRLFPRFDSIYNEDILGGEYKGIATKIIELVLTKSTSTRSFKYIFKGLFCTFGLNKRYNNHTIILKNTDKIEVPIDFSELQTNNKEFNNQFKVLTDNRAEADSILTPEFLNGLLEIKEKLQTTFRCGFYQGNFLFALDTDKDFFEPTGIREGVLNDEKHTKILNEMNSILSIVDKLGLTQ